MGVYKDVFSAIIFNLIMCLKENILCIIRYLKNCSYFNNNRDNEYIVNIENNNDYVINMLDIHIENYNNNEYQSYLRQFEENETSETNFDSFNNEECSICLQDDSNLIFKKLKCRHIFHEPCINYWLKNNNTCPICRRELN